jgi:hypothetical protein
MNENIFITDFTNIKLNDRLLTIRTPKGEIGLDIHFLLNQKSDTEFAYFNGTEIAKLFGKRYEHVTRNDQWREYVAIIEENLNTQNWVIRKMDKMFINSDGSLKAIVSRRGRYGGTWLHHDLAIQFMRMVDVRWGYELDQFMKNLITHTNKMVIERKETKFLFHPLTDAIKDIYIPAQTDTEKIKYAYHAISDLINIKALGCKAWMYKENHGLTDEQIKADGKISIRDYLSKSQLARIKQVETDIHGLIKYARLTDLTEIASRID